MTEIIDSERDYIGELHTLLEGTDDAALRSFFDDLHAADVADLLEQVDSEDISRIMFLLPPRKWAEAISELEEAVRSDVLDDLTDVQVSRVLQELPADDAVDMLDEMDDEVADKLVEHLSPEQKAAVEPLRQYDEDTAGGIMSPDFVAVPAEGTVRDAVDAIQRLKPEETEDRFYIYCVDTDGRLQGVLHPLRLVIAPPEAMVKRLLLPDVFTAHVDDDQEEVKNKFEKYDVAALPVIDAEGHILGVVTHDDALDVAEEEAEEDMFHMAGTDAEEFASASIVRAAGIRARWLLPCLLGTFCGAMVIISLSKFLHLTDQSIKIVLAFLTPIAAMGGNAGVQVSTVIVRALATDDPLAKSLGTAVARELRIVLLIAVFGGLFAGIGTLAVLNSGIIPSGHGAMDAAQGQGQQGRGQSTSLAEQGFTTDIPSDLPMGNVALAVGASMSIAILVSGVLAMLLPFAFRRLGIDPAIATGPLITTANDILSAGVYLLIAIFLLANST